MKAPGKESLEREKTREREEGRGSKGRQIVKEKEKGKKRDREGSRGDWSPGYGWIMETRGWRGSCLGGGWSFRVHCQVSKPMGQWSPPLSRHLTNMWRSWFVFHTPPTNHLTKIVSEEKSVREIDDLSGKDDLDQQPPLLSWFVLTWVQIKLLQKRLKCEAGNVNCLVLVRGI